MIDDNAPIVAYSGTELSKYVVELVKLNTVVVCITSATCDKVFVDPIDVTERLVIMPSKSPIFPRVTT
jgi:hypothetical protein